MVKRETNQKNGFKDVLSQEVIMGVTMIGVSPTFRGQQAWNLNISQT